MGRVLMIGAGRLGGAILDGWRSSGSVLMEDVMVRVRTVSEAAGRAQAAGAVLGPPDTALADADIVVLAVKPQAWRSVAETYAPRLSPQAIILSLAVGVKLGDLAAGFGGRRVVRVMPTTGVAIARGVASIVSPNPEARAEAHALFDPIATTVDLEDEGLMDAASAVSGSAPAYFYAFTEALQAAGEAQGLPAEAARILARATFVSAAGLLDASGAEPGDLRRQVASPGGTTEAALKVFLGEGGLPALTRDAVAAAIARAEELAR